MLEGRGLVPFRLTLQDVGRALASKYEGWDCVEAVVGATYGRDSAAAEAARVVITAAQAALLVLDGFDEAPAHRGRIIDWLAELPPQVSVIVTSRPAAVHGYTDLFGKLGFMARKVLPLTEAARTVLVGKFAQRQGLSAAATAGLLAALSKPAYESLAKIPVTLNLLLHVLTRDPGAVLSRTEIYARALQMIQQARRLTICKGAVAKFA